MGRAGTVRPTPERGARAHRATAWVLVLTGLAAATLAGCGRKGPPMPPVIRKADATRDLAVFQEATESVLRWSYPSLTTAGGPLPDVEAVEVWRAALPAGQEPPLDQGQQQMHLSLLNAHGELISTLDPAALEQATRGPSLEVRDNLLTWYEANKDRMPLVIWYAVRTRCCGGRPSRFSNIARLVPLPPPQPPEGLELEVSADGIIVRWQADQGVAGLVERSADGQQWRSITPQPVKDGERLDRGAQQGKRWHYRVRAVKQLGTKGRVVGDPGPALMIDYPDTYPPAPASNLVCLPEGDMVRLRWDAAADAAFYRIFRMREGESWRQLGAADGTSFEDPQPLVGNLTYAVKSVDKAGNDAEAVTCTTVMGFPP